MLTTRNFAEMFLWLKKLLFSLEGKLQKEVNYLVLMLLFQLVHRLFQKVVDDFSFLNFYAKFQRRPGFESLPSAGGFRGLTAGR